MSRAEADRVTVIARNLGDMFDPSALVLVIINATLDGEGLSGASLVVSPDADRAALAKDLPKLLRQMADDAERDLLAPPRDEPHYHVGKGAHGPSGKGTVS